MISADDGDTKHSQSNAGGGLSEYPTNQQMTVGLDGQDHASSQSNSTDVLIPVVEDAPVVASGAVLTPTPPYEDTSFDINNDLNEIELNDMKPQSTHKDYNYVSAESPASPDARTRKNNLFAMDDFQHSPTDMSSKLRPAGTFLTSVDQDNIQQLDDAYEKALLQREIGWNARYISVRQNAGLSLWCFFVFLMIGTIFFDINTNWTISESLLFSMYTITTVGYGNHEIPQTEHVLIFISFYIFIGIALLTILAAQTYQWIVLEITWAQYEKDNKKLLVRHDQSKKASADLEAAIAGESSPEPLMSNSEAGTDLNKPWTERALDTGIKYVDKIQAYIKNNPSGQLVVVMVPFSFLIVLGAIVVGAIEEWGWIESIYFAVVSMTTVGFGDYYPTKDASNWFCVIWLPFSVGFLSLYLGSLAQLYISLSSNNVKRIEKKMRYNLNHARETQRMDREEALARANTPGFGLAVDSASDDTSDRPAHMLTPSPRQRDQTSRFTAFKTPSSLSKIDSHVVLSPDDSVEERRKSILENCGIDGSGNRKSDFEAGETMKTMQDVINAVKLNMATPRRQVETDGHTKPDSPDSDAGSDLLSIKSTRHYNTTRGVEKKASFALRVLLQERFCHIISHEIAGYQSDVKIKNNTLSVTIDSLKLTNDKWLIPRRARRSFRAVAFEVLYFVGERDLIVRGAGAVFELKPREVQGLFAPLLAAFGDADTMEAWMMRTHVMAGNEFHQSDEEALYARQIKYNAVEERRTEKITMNMTADPVATRNVIGNAVTNQ